uniref:Inositol-3-phosphate synthase n=1 Tax=Timema genevievae TaxID=629358 RepID=A0A7R9PQK1_TIMGE|nr:unnamed protein product [Timema genevievae]
MSQRPERQSVTSLRNKGERFCRSDQNDGTSPFVSPFYIYLSRTQCRQHHAAYSTTPPRLRRTTPRSGKLTLGEIHFSSKLVSVTSFESRSKNALKYPALPREIFEGNRDKGERVGRKTLLQNIIYEFRHSSPPIPLLHLLIHSSFYYCTQRNKPLLLEDQTSANIPYWTILFVDLLEQEKMPVIINSPNVKYTEDYIESIYEYHTTSVEKCGNKLIYSLELTVIAQASPHCKKLEIRTQRHLPKLGLMLVGWGGNNGSTLTAAILANKLHLTWETKEGPRSADW